MLEKLIETIRVEEVSAYSLYRLQLLHNLYPETSKLVKECSVRYLSPDRLRTGGRVTRQSCSLKSKCTYFGATISCLVPPIVPDKCLNSYKIPQNGVKWMRRKIHRNKHTHNAVWKRLKRARESAPFHSGVHRSEHGLRICRTYQTSAYKAKRDYG